MVEQFLSNGGSSSFESENTDRIVRRLQKDVQAVKKGVWSKIKSRLVG